MAASPERPALDFGTHPTPAERAEAVVLRLEQFIRENRTAHGGRPFRKWQDMGRIEIIAAILDAERTWRTEQSFLSRVLVVGAAAVVTIGFWGTIAAFGSSADLRNEAVFLIGGGLVLFGALGAVAIRSFSRRLGRERRDRRLRHIATLDQRLKALDRYLEKRVKDLEEAVKEIQKIDV